MALGLYFSGSMSICRWGANMASIGPYLYICGGSDDSSRLDTVERYDAWVPAEPMSSSRNGVGVCSDDGRIYAIGRGSGVCEGGIRDFHLHHSHSKYGLESWLKSLLYLFLRLYAILCTVTEPIVF